MTNRQFQLTTQQIDKLLKAYESCKDHPTRVRYQAVHLYGTGHPVAEIKALTGCSRTSLMEWCRRYREQGVQGLADGRTGGNRAKLTKEDICEIGRRLCKYSPRELLGVSSHPAGLWTIKDLQRAVKEWYGLEYRSSSSYRRLFICCGFSYDLTMRAFRPVSERRQSMQIQSTENKRSV